MAYFRALAAIALVAAFAVVAGVASLTQRFGVLLPPGLAVAFCRCMTTILGVRVHCRGTAQSDRPAIFAANHASWLDILALGSDRSLCFLAKKEISDWPAIGRLARVQGCVFVDRGRRMAIPKTNREIAARLSQGRSIVLFAEGTTGDGTLVRRFRSSHFQAGLLAGISVDIQPVSIVYPCGQGLPLGRSGRARLAWYGDMDFWPSLLTLIRHRPVDCEIVYGRPFALEAELDRKSAARQAENQVRELVADGIREAERFRNDRPQGGPVDRTRDFSTAQPAMR